MKATLIEKAAKNLKPILLLFLMPLFFSAQAQDLPGPQSLHDKLVQAIEVSSQGQLEIVAVKETPLPNVFEVELNTGELLYSDVSGDFLFAGDMFAVTGDGLLNLSSDTRNLRNVERIANVPEEEMIIFSPDEVAASVTVFTDVDCTYCRKLHGDIEELLANGVQIRYLAYPRGGTRADSIDKMYSVWCSDDRKRSLTQAKRGQNLPVIECESPILAHYELGNQIGIRGTPAIVLPDGQVLPGYRDAQTLMAVLNVN